MAPFTLPFRNLHLDFHTSEAIPELAADFEPQAFAETLAAAGVQSVCCFARCHHGWLYYRSAASPERQHPTLQRPDLLQEQITACHRVGIRVPIYTTVQWDHYTATRHPEWLCRMPYGRPHQSDERRAYGGFYQNLCINTPYRQWLRQHTQELLEQFQPDGLFFDMTVPLDCACATCQAAMRAAGLDPADALARQAFGAASVRAFEAEFSALARQSQPDLSLYYNGDRGGYTLDAFSHLEFDVLPGYGAGGYMNFPLHLRYARTLGKEMMAQTGRFHTAWGDFHSFKHATALRFECSQLLALGAKVCVGDQLHPRGRLCPHTYARLGAAFAEVASKEPWCVGARGLAEIGVFSPPRVGGGDKAALLGAARLLDEAALQWDILDAQSELAGYRLLILPDAVPLAPALAARLSAYLAAGGALLASHAAGLTPDGQDFALAEFGLRLQGPSAFDPEYLRPEGPLAGPLPPIEHVTYSRGLMAEPGPGTTVHCWTVEPYFQRQGDRFCSHRHTPSSGRRGYPAMTQAGRCLRFAHPVFGTYQRNGADWLATLVWAAIRHLLPQPLLRHDGPSSLVATLTEQAAQQRYLAHLLHFIPERRSFELDHVRDTIPLHDLTVSLALPRPVLSAELVPHGQPLVLRHEAGRQCFTVPRLAGHQMVALRWQ